MSDASMAEKKASMLATETAACLADSMEASVVAQMAAMLDSLLDA